PATSCVPVDGYRSALNFGRADVSLVLFPVSDARAFDAVVCDELGYVERVEVKQAAPASHWIWGAVTATGRALHSLRLLWESRHRNDDYLGSLLNAYIAAGNPVRGLHCGEVYMDV